MTPDHRAARDVDSAGACCESCGVSLSKHLGLYGTCSALQAALAINVKHEAEIERLRAVIRENSKK